MAGVDVDAATAQVAALEVDNPAVEGATEEKVDKKALFSFFNKKDIKAFNEADGVDLKTDGMAIGMDAALRLLEDRITAHRNNPKKCKKPEMWDFNARVLGAFKASRRDLLASYLRWTVKDGIPEEGQEEFEAAATFNVDKAFRRLEGYAVWMLDHKEMLDASPFSADHFRDGYLKMGNFCPDVTDGQGRVMWIIDVNRYPDQEKPNPEALIRMTCYTLHCLALDADAQRRGVVILEDLAYIGFGKIMKVFPMEAKKDIDKLTQGASPVRMHKFCIIRAPFWMNLIMKFMGLFMSKKMKGRVGVFGKDFPKLITEAGGPEYIPSGFASGGTNTTCKDRFFGHAFPWPNRIDKPGEGANALSPEQQQEAEPSEEERREMEAMAKAMQEEDE